MQSLYARCTCVLLLGILMPCLAWGMEGSPRRITFADESLGTAGNSHKPSVDNCLEAAVPKVAVPNSVHSTSKKLMPVAAGADCSIKAMAQLAVQFPVLKGYDEQEIQDVLYDLQQSGDPYKQAEFNSITSKFNRYAPVATVDNLKTREKLSRDILYLLIDKKSGWSNLITTACGTFGTFSFFAAVYYYQQYVNYCVPNS